MKSSAEPASDHAPFLGWWRLVSCEVEFRVSGQRKPMYDSPACGFLVFDTTGRMMTVIEPLKHEVLEDNRKPREARRGMAYTGRYHIEGSQWRTEVDASLIGWTGSVQERSFTIESGRLHVCSNWCVSPLHGDEVVRARLVWERCR